MPPKPKYDKAQMIAAALEIARESGISAVTAREVATRLGCSTRPVFTCFSGMEALQDAVKEAARTMFSEYLQKADDYVPAFKMRGMQMVRFAKAEPKLFQLLFMTESASDCSEWMRSHLSGFETDIAAIRETYQVSDREAEMLFNQLLICTCGICTLEASEVCAFTEQELATIFGCAFGGMISIFRGGKTEFAGVMPVHKNSPEAARLSALYPVSE